MAIQNRRGLEADFNPNKMLPGEWAVSTDKKYVRMCFAPGICFRMATYEAFETDMEQIRAILAEAQNIHEAIARIQSEIYNTAIEVENNTALAESYTHGGTGKREGEDTDNAQYYMNEAKKAAGGVDEYAREQLKELESSILDTMEEVEANEEEGKIAGALAVKEFAEELKKSNISVTTSHGAVDIGVDGYIEVSATICMVKLSADRANIIINYKIDKNYLHANSIGDGEYWFIDLDKLKTVLDVPNLLFSFEQTAVTLHRNVVLDGNSMIVLEATLSESERGVTGIMLNGEGCLCRDINSERVFLSVDGIELFNKTIDASTILTSPHYFGSLVSNGSRLILGTMENIAENLLYSYDFENADDLTNTLNDSVVTISDEQVYSGQHSLKIDKKAWIKLNISSGYNVISVMLYDNMSTSGSAIAAVSNKYYLGMRSNASSTTYVVRDTTDNTNSGFRSTGVERTLGWHELRWDFRDASSCVMYIDGVQVAVAENVSAPSYIHFGDQWSDGSNMYFDDLKIYSAVFNKNRLQDLVDRANAILAVNNDANLEAAITTAQTVLDDSDATWSSTDAAEKTLQEAIVEAQYGQFTGTFKKMKLIDLIRNKNAWSLRKEGGQSYIFEPEGLNITSAEASADYAIAGYVGESFRNFALSFKCISDLSADNSWAGFYIQSDPVSYPWRQKGVLVVGKEDKVELQIYGEKSEVLTKEGDYLKSGEEHNVIFGIYDASDPDLNAPFSLTSNCYTPGTYGTIVINGAYVGERGES